MIRLRLKIFESYQWFRHREMYLGSLFKLSTSPSGFIEASSPVNFSLLKGIDV